VLGTRVRYHGGTTWAWTSTVDPSAMPFGIVVFVMSYIAWMEVSASASKGMLFRSMWSALAADSIREVWLCALHAVRRKVVAASNRIFVNWVLLTVWSCVGKTKKWTNKCDKIDFTRSLGEHMMQCFRLWLARLSCVSASLLCGRNDVYIGLLNLGECLVINGIHCLEARKLYVVAKTII